MTQQKHFYWLDLLRFVSAFLVVLAHYRGSFFVEFGALPVDQQHILNKCFYLLTRFGEEPVIVFFVLSGFLVGGGSIERLMQGRVDVQSYAIDRAVRIMVPLLASSVLVILIFSIMGVPIPYRDIIGSLFSFQGVFTRSDFNVVLWSLAYEVWFYVLMGCVMYLVKDGLARKIAVFLLLAFCLYMLSRLKSIYFFIWLMGALAYLLPRARIRYLPAKIWALLVLLVVAFVLNQATSASKSMALDLPFLDRETTSLFLALVTCLFIHHLVVAVPQSAFAQKLDKLGTVLAAFSYTLYLTHYPVMQLLAYWGFPKSEGVYLGSVLLYLAAVAIGLLAAYGVYLLSEKHTYRIKQWVKQRWLHGAG